MHKKRRETRSVEKECHNLQIHVLQGPIPHVTWAVMLGFTGEVMLGFTGEEVMLGFTGEELDLIWIKSINYSSWELCFYMKLGIFHIY